MNALARVVSLVSLSLLLGCSEKKEGGSTSSTAPSSKSVAGLGENVKLLAPGPAIDLFVNSDRSVATFLKNAEKPRLRNVADHVRVGELWAVPLSGGEPKSLAEGVTNEPGGFLYSPDGKSIAILSGYDTSSHAGTLVVRSLKELESPPRKLGSAPVAFVVYSPDSKRLAYVEQGNLTVAELDSGQTRSVGPKVSTARFSPDSKYLVFRKDYDAGAGLSLLDLSKPGEPKALSEQVADYDFSPDGKYLAYTARDPKSPNVRDLFVVDLSTGKPEQRASGTTFFLFSPDSQLLARNQGSAPGKYGDLFVGKVMGEPGKKLGQKVARAKFSPDSKAIAYLELYDDSSEAGVMGVAEVTAAKGLRVGNRVPNFEWSLDSKLLVLNSRFLQPTYSVDLLVWRRGEEKSFKLAEGVFGYGFVPGKDSTLILRNACARETRACALSEVDLGKKIEPGKEKESLRKVFENAFSFKPSADGKRVLVTFARYEPQNSYDVSVLELASGKIVKLAEQIALPAYFVGDDGKKVVFLSTEKSRPGVFLGEASF